MKRVIIPFVASAFILGITLALGLYLLNSPPSQGRRFLAFTVNSGESFKSISLRLKAEGFIRSEPWFYYLGRLTGKSGQLKAGEYELNTEMSPWEIINVVTGSHVRLYRITIREGMNMFQVARTLESNGLVDEMAFLESAWDSQFLDDLRIPSATVEGYLFPETYFIPRGASARTIIRIFVEMFWQKIPQSTIDEARSGPLSFHEYVIMASMIEKETGLIGEMPLISSVFHNRLNSKMRFQSDPTAVYDLLPHGGRVTRQHLFRKTPFNTYQIPGLPLTPVSNPGRLSIHDAIHPQDTNYLYFVSRRDGSHHFSATYHEHKEAIDRFLRSP